MPKKQTEQSEPCVIRDLEITETYDREDGYVRLSVDGEMTRIETFVPAAMGAKLKMGDKVKVTIEVA